MVVAAPPGTLERRFVLAQALRVLGAGAGLIALAPKDRGGTRVLAELEAFGCSVRESARRHHRICLCRRPDRPTDIGVAITAGGPQWAPGLELWSQPGVFSWDRLDPGTALLIASAPSFSGRGADLGCGVGALGRAVLSSEAITGLTFVDIDRRAIAAARRNVAEPRARFLHWDVRQANPSLADLDFVIMNPPFHEGGVQDRALGMEFIRAAAAMLKPGGVCHLVANDALPYERTLEQRFATVTPLGRSGGYKLYEARR